MTATRALFVAVAAGALGVGAWLSLDSRNDEAPSIDGYVLARPRPLPAVELIDERGSPFATARFAGHWSFLFFGYTYCPDICPLTLVALAEVKRELAAQGVREPVEYYLVSVDPERDTPERLGEYVAYFDSEFHGVTGTLDALEALAAATETLFAIPEGQDPEHYLVSHSANVLLLDPHGDVHAVLTPPHQPAKLAADFTKIAARFAAAR